MPTRDCPARPADGRRLALALPARLLCALVTRARRVPGNFIAIAWLIAVLGSVLAGCSRAPLQQQEAFVFGTRVELLIAGLSEAEARPAAAAVLREFDRLHRAYHAWQPSELSALNTALAAGQRQPISPEMAAVLADARRLAQAGDWLFDPGIGRLVELWGFHADELPVALPAPVAVAAWRAAQPSIADLQIAPGADGHQQASSGKRELAIDLGGYLKGFALDRAGAILKAHGVRHALVNIGGNVLALGSKNGERWRIGLQHPRQPGALATIALDDGEAVGTSGDYQRYFEVDGRRYSHLLDPRSGEPVTHTQALCVLITARAAAGTLSDVASKPLFIAGADWPELARRLAVEHVLRVDSRGAVEVSAAMQQRVSFIGGPPAELSIVR
ncbi:MAG: FAD:protein FMN transferase [Candidatus Accumulibacter sp.]|uniref:FAD:protein FMN transferase n=1 Tax=Accumulibacter sp. TaxID=2053492 RepID=UPI00287A5421|nr:FAD:protein FMN transferase [Accumulibacter sp.]MDS4013363.1 FAD:protein FMN transferase [Accumulibacter sp.]